MVEQTIRRLTPAAKSCRPVGTKVSAIGLAPSNAQRLSILQTCLSSFTAFAKERYFAERKATVLPAPLSCQKVSRFELSKRAETRR